VFLEIEMKRRKHPVISELGIEYSLVISHLVNTISQTALVIGAGAVRGKSELVALFFLTQRREDAKGFPGNNILLFIASLFGS